MLHSSCLLMFHLPVVSVGTRRLVCAQKMESVTTTALLASFSSVGGLLIFMAMFFVAFHKQILRDLERRRISRIKRRCVSKLKHLLETYDCMMKLTSQQNIQLWHWESCI